MFVDWVQWVVRGHIRRSFRSPAGHGERHENHIVEVVDSAESSWPKPPSVWLQTWRGKGQLAAGRGMISSPAGERSNQVDREFPTRDIPIWFSA